jgi:hypothetical protein
MTPTAATTNTALSIACPICDAPPNQSCRNISDREARQPHEYRFQLAKELAAALAAEMRIPEKDALARRTRNALGKIWIEHLTVEELRGLTDLVEAVVERVYGANVNVVEVDFAHGRWTR